MNPFIIIIGFCLFITVLFIHILHWRIKIPLRLNALIFIFLT